jgi:hypothetical protein
MLGAKLDVFRRLPNQTSSNAESESDISSLAAGYLFLNLFGNVLNQKLEVGRARASHYPTCLQGPDPA